MIKVPRLKTSFRNYGDSDFESKSQSIAIAFTDNDNFENPTPSIADLLEAISEYSDSLAAAVDGGRLKVAEKNKNRRALEAMLRTLASYATMIAKGDRDILISSGFDLVKDGESQEIAAPESLKITSGKLSGEVVVRAVKAKGANTYSHEYTPDPLTENSAWTVELDSKATHTFSELKPMTKYWFRTGPIGKGGVKAYCSAVSWIVQ